MRKMMLIIVAVAIVFTNCTENIKKENSSSLPIEVDTIAFNNFIENFTELNIPYSFYLDKKTMTFGTYNMAGDTISERLASMFICDICNLCNSKFIDAKIGYTYLGKTATPNNFYIVTYYVRDRSQKLEQVILATYSKKSKSVISKINVWADKKLEYFVESSINGELEIKLNTIYSYYNYTYDYDHGISLPNEKYPGYFVIKNFKSIYKINENGKIILIEKTDKKKHIAKLNNRGEYIYPAVLPK